MKKLIMNESFQDLKNQQILTHWQKGIEILRVIEGTMKCLINGKEYTMHKDDICVINENHLHCVYCDDTNKKTRFQCLKILPQYLSGDNSIHDKYISPILCDRKLSHIISSANQPFAIDIAYYMDCIEELERLQSDGYELLIVSYLHLIFQKLYIHYKGPNISKETFIDRDALMYYKLADFIYKNYDQKLTLTSIASQGNISKNKCCALFRKYAQHTPIDFLNLYRLKVSMEMLKMTNARVSEIAYACGFSQQSYYNRLFLKIYGVTPKEYRKKVGSSL